MIRHSRMRITTAAALPPTTARPRCASGRDRLASAMTTALSPDNRMSMLMMRSRSTKNCAEVVPASTPLSKHALNDLHQDWHGGGRQRAIGDSASAESGRAAYDLDAGFEGVVDRAIVHLDRIRGLGVRRGPTDRRNQHGHVRPAQQTPGRRSEHHPLETGDRSVADDDEIGALLAR